MHENPRQARIRELIARNGECSVEELAKQLNVSGMTVRRDLQALATDGRVIRTYGGATLGERATFEFTFLERINQNRDAKETIASAAIELARSCRTVMLDASTTTLAIARQLRGIAGLTVITTSLPAAAELQHDLKIDVLLPGGYVRPGSPDLAGSLTEGNLGLLRADVAFLGADAIDHEGDVFTDPPDNATVLLRMVASAERVYVVADHSKMGKSAMRCFGHLRQWTGLITDQKCDREFVQGLRELNVHVIVAPGE